MRTARLLTFALAALLALPGVASAKLAPTGDVTHDDQFSRFTLPMTCTEPQAGRTDCLVEIATSYQFTGPFPKLERLGSPVQADRRQVTVPVGGTQKVVIETEKVIEGIAKRGGSFFVDLAVSMPGADSSYSARTFGNYGRVGSCGKGSPLLLKWSGPGKLYFVTNPNDTFDRVSGVVTRDTFMAKGSTYRVQDGAVSYSYKGVDYSFAKGSEFIITCSGVTSVAGGAAVLTPSLTSGRVSVSSTKKRMRQPAAYVQTNEGNLGTRAKETAKFVVTRDKARQVSTLHFQKGKAGTITPWNTRTRSPCTSGQTLTVNRKGVISRA